MNELLNVIEYVWWPMLAVIAALGFFAIFNPRLFREFAYRTSHWVDTDKFVEKMNTHIEVDQLVLRHCRVFGGIVLFATALLAHLYFAHMVLR